MQRWIFIFVTYENYLRKKLLLNTDPKFAMFCVNSNNTYKKHITRKQLSGCLSLFFFFLNNNKTYRSTLRGAIYYKKTDIPKANFTKLNKQSHIRKTRHVSKTYVMHSTKSFDTLSSKYLDTFKVFLKLECFWFIHVCLISNIFWIKNFYQN